MTSKTRGRLRECDHGKVWLGKARPGMVRPGWTRESRRGMIGFGRAGRVLVRHSKVWRDLARNSRLG